MSVKQTVQEQFGANAAAYVASRTHAKGASLPRLVELVNPQPDWRTLDIATGAGHVALAFAPHVAQAYATDITEQMLASARKLAADRGLTNLTIEPADAEKLLYPDGSFHLVTSRIAPHHFEDIPAFIREAVRVLQSGGLLGVVDNIVPSGASGDYVNALEKFRDPSHVRCLSGDEWVSPFVAAGLEIVEQEIMGKLMVFEEWAARHDTYTQSYLRAMLSEVSGMAADFLTPEFGAEQTTFQLQEIILVGRKG